MKDFLNVILMAVRGIYYSIILILGILGIVQVIETSEPNDINIVVTTIAFLAIGYSIRNAINMIKEN